MLEFSEKSAPAGDGETLTTLTLPLDLRQKSRQRVTLDNGEPAGVFLKRGSVLHDGDLLRTADGIQVEVKAAAEHLSMISSSDPLLLARACYHLGNRHMPLQIEPGRVLYLHDHVLDEMLRGLGLEVEQTEAPFSPEPGAYGGDSHGGHGGDGHAH